MEFLESMRSTPGCRPGVVAYSASVAALSHGHKWQQACEKLAQMAKDGLQPNVTTYSALITALELGQQWQKALMAFEEMSSMLEPDTICLNASIKAAAKGSQWRSIERFLQRFDNLSLWPDARTFASSIAGLARAGQWQRALHCLERCLREASSTSSASSASSSSAKIDVAVKAAVFGLSKQWLWQRVLQLLAAFGIQGPQRASAEASAAVAKGGHALDMSSRDAGPMVTLGRSYRTFRACFATLREGSILPRLEYDNAMIAFESSPAGCHMIRDVSSWYGMSPQPPKCNPADSDRGLTARGLEVEWDYVLSRFFACSYLLQTISTFAAQQSYV